MLLKEVYDIINRTIKEEIKFEFFKNTEKTKKKPAQKKETRKERMARMIQKEFDKLKEKK